MNRELATATETSKEIQALPRLEFTPIQIDLIKRTICRGATNDELALFLYTCKRTGLDPLARQIYAVKRWDTGLQREVMAIQTGIDGYRLTGERTKRYSPGKEPTFTHDKDGKLVSATAYVMKQTEDGVWHEIAATAHYTEYVQNKKDGAVNHMWAKMPHSQLAKCAEALALRRAFPNELSGVYTDDEMGQSENPTDKKPIEPPRARAEVIDAEVVDQDNAVAPKTGGDVISLAQGKRLYAIWKSSGKSDDDVHAYIKSKYGIDSTKQIRKSDYEAICEWAQSGDAQE